MGRYHAQAVQAGLSPSPYTHKITCCQKDVLKLELAHPEDHSCSLSPSKLGAAIFSVATIYNMYIRINVHIHICTSWAISLWKTTCNPIVLPGALDVAKTTSPVGCSWSRRHREKEQRAPAAVRIGHHCEENETLPWCIKSYIVSRIGLPFRKVKATLCTSIY